MSHSRIGGTVLAIIGVVFLLFAFTGFRGPRDRIGMSAALILSAAFLAASGYLWYVGGS